MTTTTAGVDRQLTARDLEPILEVSAKLAAPFDLTTMLSEVVVAAKSVLKVDRGTVWLYDRETDEVVLRFSEDIANLRIPAGTGIVGTCARNRRVINVPDCYSDPRFDPSADRRSGYRTRCMLTLPLIDHQDVLVGVMQVLNKADGVFDATDERIAMVLAAQVAVALQRVRMTEAVIEGERMREQLELARVVQMSSLPAGMPAVAGYDVHGATRPADLTGGDTFDLALVEQGVLMVLGDATGHGIGPALSVTQMHAMLRMAFRMGSDLDTAFVHVNNQLAQTVPEGQFITAFIGLLDAAEHRVRFHSGGQAPILHYRASEDAFEHHHPTSFPLAALPLDKVGEAPVIHLAPGDILALISDGIFEYCNVAGEEFGEARVREAIAANADMRMGDLTARLYDAVKAFAGGAPQEDDMTVVLVKRDRGETRSFARTNEAIEDIVAFTERAFAAQGIDPQLRTPVDLALEELFTNVVKYSGAGRGGPVRIGIAAIAGGVEAVVTADDVGRFDPTAAPDADIGLPLEERRPGGLGLHLIRRLVDSLEYRYDEGSRRGWVRLRKTLSASTKGE